MPDDKELTDHLDTLNLAEIDEKISDSKVGELKYNTYIKNLEAQKGKDKMSTDRNTVMAESKNLKAEKVKQLQGIDTGIEGLAFTTEGFTYFGSAPEMISDSQLMKLNNDLCNLYDSKIKVVLVDRGESVGYEGIDEYVQRAEDTDTTILMSFVGEEKAKVPEKVGVFVVTKGNVK